jgi:ribosomal protein S3AE
MAKKVQKTKKTLRKIKKKWFNLVTPDYLGSVELGELTAYEPASLPGRTVCIPLKEITGSPRDGSSKIKLRVVEVRGETCTTEPIEIFVQNAQVGRSDRRAKEKIICVVDGTTKDKQKIRIKVYILLQNRVIRAIRTALHSTTTNFVNNYISKREAKDIFTTSTSKNIANILKSDLKSIYPAQIIVWRIKKM